MKKGDILFAANGITGSSGGFWEDKEIPYIQDLSPQERDSVKEREEGPVTRRRTEVPIWQKTNLTLEEAAEYSNIGIHKLRELTNARNCRFVIWNGSKRLIKRRLFDEFLDSAYSI